MTNWRPSRRPRWSNPQQHLLPVRRQLKPLHMLGQLLRLPVFKGPPVQRRAVFTKAARHRHFHKVNAALQTRRKIRIDRSGQRQRNNAVLNTRQVNLHRLHRSRRLRLLIRTLRLSLPGQLFIVRFRRDGRSAIRQHHSINARSDLVQIGAHIQPKRSRTCVGAGREVQILSRPVKRRSIRIRHLARHLRRFARINRIKKQSVKAIRKRLWISNPLRIR